MPTNANDEYLGTIDNSTSGCVISGSAVVVKYKYQTFIEWHTCIDILD